MPIVEVDGQEIEFPDDMSQDEIKSVLRQKFTPQYQQSDTVKAAGTGTGGIGRTAARLGRNIAIGTASIPDVALLPAKTAMLGIGIGAEKLGFDAFGKKLQQIGMTPNIGEQTQGAIDYVTGGQLQPRNKIEESADFVTQIMGGPVGAKLIGKAASFLNKKTILPTSKAIAEKSSSLFKSGKAKGAEFSDDAAGEIAKSVEDVRVTDPFAKEAIGPDAFDDIAKRLTEARKNPMTLDSYEALDKEWGSLGHQAAISGNLDLSRKYDILQSKLRSVAQNPEFVKGAQSGISDYQKAVKLWAIKSKLRDIEQIKEFAKYYVGGEASGLKAGFARLAKSNKIYKFSPKEVKMIEKAAQTGNTEGLLRTLGSRLMVIGGAIKGGPAGAAAGYAASQAARGSASIMKGVETSKIGKSIAKEATNISPDLINIKNRIPVKDLKEILSLPPDQARAALAFIMASKPVTKKTEENK